MNRGFTLLELMVAIAVMAVLTSVAAFTIGTVRSAAQPIEIEAWSAARAKSIRVGSRVQVRAGKQEAVFLPDGRVVGDGFDPLTGEPNADSLVASRSAGAARR